MDESINRLDNTTRIVYTPGNDVCGIWIPDKVTFDNKSRLKLEIVELAQTGSLSQEEVVAFYIDIGSDCYRVVPMKHSDVEGVFLMSGQSLAPGEQPPSLESVIWNNSSQTLPTSKCWLSEGNIYVCFRCPCCHFPNNVDRNAIHSRTGVISVCEACGEISHLSASCQSTWSLLPRRVTGGILILRTGIEEWIRAHPNFYTLNKKDELNLLYYYYGLWFHCPQCHSKLGLYYSNASNYCCPQCGHDSDFLGIRLPLSRRMYRYLRS